ncbi:MAG TPA: MHYT domain-containing protein [Solirubrobacteraceae bacterium]
MVTRPHISRSAVLSAAMFMGLAVTAMHYLGMASMEMSATIHWHIVLVLASVAIGIVASLIALSLLVRIRVSADGFGFARRLGAAVLLGFGVAELHYTAMAACTFAPVIGRCHRTTA